MHQRSLPRLRAYLRLILRPWKVVSAALGTAFFVWGAWYWDVPTWDVGVSVLMSVACYLIAPYAVSLGVRALRDQRRNRMRDLLIAIALVYFVASGTYEIYNTIRMGHHPITYWYNLAFSVSVTVIAGLIWSYDGSLKELAREIGRATSGR